MRRSSSRARRHSTGSTVCDCGAPKGLQSVTCRACNTAWRNLPENLVHGTEGSYKNRGCRCERCVEAALYIRRIRRWAGMVNVHNANGYKNGCRCETCRAAEKIARPRKTTALV